MLLKLELLNFFRGLDFFSDFFQQSAALVNCAELAEINGFLSTNSIATIYYITQKAFDRKKAVKEIELLTEIFEIAPVNKAVIVDALKLNFKDFEDAIIHEAARCIPFHCARKCALYRR